MKTKLVMAMFALVSAAVTAAGTESASSTARPNVIVILMDDMGRSDFSCFGSKINKTPNIDRLAAEGMILENFYGSPSCTPTRTQLMTGCYPRRVGMSRGAEIGVLRPEDPIGLNPDELILPKVFKAAGYRTGMIGKWHLGNQPGLRPWEMGFDHYFGNLMGHHGSVHDHPGKLDFAPFPLYRDGVVLDRAVNPVLLTDWYTDEAVAFIEQHAGKKEPFFLYVAHHLAHVPIYPGFRFGPAAAWDTYRAAVLHTDWAVGEIMKAVAKANITQQTMMVFLSDNGPFLPAGGSSEPLRGGKGSTLEGGVRLPCIVRWPAVVKPKAAARTVSSVMDLVPTFTRLFSLPLPRKIDGRDIMPTLRGEEGNTAKGAYAYFSVDRLEAIRQDRWKLDLLKGQLYDLEADPSESQNQAENQPQLVGSLKKMAGALRAEIGDEVAGVEGTERRPPGRVKSIDPATESPGTKRIYNPYADSRRF